MLGNGRQVIFGQRKEHGDGLKLSDDEHGVGVRRVDDISRINLPQPDAPANRGRDVAISKIQFGAINRRLVVAHRSLELVGRGPLGIHLLLRHGAGILQKTLVASEVQLGIAQ